MLDLELSDAGLLGVAACISAMTRRLSSRRLRASSSAGKAPARTKPPSRLSSGSSSASVARRSRSSAPQSASSRGAGARELGRQVRRRFENARDARPPRRGRRESRRDRAGRRGRGSSRDSERRKSGAPASAAAQRIAQRRRLDQEIERIEPLVDRVGIGERARQPLGEEPRAGGRRGQVDRRQERAVARRRSAFG